MRVSLLEFVMWLEQIAYYMHSVTHPATPQMHLDVVEGALDKDTKLTFKVSRGEAHALIDVWLDAEKQNTERVRVRGKHEDVDNLAELKECVCARLSSGVRTLNFLKLILKEHLRMRPIKDSPQHTLCVVPGDIEVWLDEWDRLKVQGGSCMTGLRTYVADDDDDDAVNAASKEHLFFFEDPFAVPKSGAKHALRPGTALFFSDVLGALGFETLGQWGEPMAVPTAGRETASQGKEDPQLGTRARGG